ncbi:M23 family metallopeptidase [Amphiplicatus metriothermophilus]|nr:M23 family metallopeptidase [Amphiplicatus metriothermophilus]MBB5520010.1 murein DD-endopeptidase MepM/ murein hydrolase activator NlpD [Amphiplicatus metriothermophilus]
MVALVPSLRIVAPAVALAVLAGCATAPRPAGGDFPQTLRLCPGGGIANAPPAHGDGRVRDFDPMIVARGVMLARAPVEGCLSSGYGPRRGGAGAFHKGVDLYTGRPRPVLAAGDGIVAEAGKRRGFGDTILIRHRNGVETRYAHLSGFAPGMRRGARVRAGDVIGRTGRTGNATAVHLHYEVLIDGKALNPLTVGR